MEHHNAVFIGKDENGKARYANLRGTLGDFKGEAYGSDKRHFFRLPVEKPSGSIHIFESAIDLLSYAIYMKCAGMEYRSENLISLAGVYQPKKDIEKSKFPVALSLFLEKHPEIDTIYLHLDNDKTGRLCTKTLTYLLEKRVKVVDIKGPIGYWLGEYASTVKRGKGLLFDKNKIDEILMDINADRVIEANNRYREISKIITSYRRIRRNENKTEISDFLGIPHFDFLNKIDEYLFMNRGDIVILNTAKLLKDKYKNQKIEFNDEKLIRAAILLIHKNIIETYPDGVRNISALTKNTKLFKEIKQYIENLK